MDKLPPTERLHRLPLRPHALCSSIVGFSIIEICLAIAIIASAFIAVLGLLPAGMRVYDSSVYITAQSRMVAHLTGMMQTGGYNKTLNQYRSGSVLFFYDVDGSYLDSDTTPVAGYESKRIYAARAFALQQNIPSSGGEKFNLDKTAAKVIIAMGHNDAPVVDQLRKLTDEASIKALTPSARVKTETVLLTRMDSEMDP
jgi:uncharacterized protein (TIGR02598 family)